MKNRLNVVEENERVFLDFLDYLFPYLEPKDQVNILSLYKEWLKNVSS